MQDSFFEEITVLAKVKPTPSRKHGALICTAGINKHGEWVRMYPIRWDTFFKTNDNVKFHRWDKIVAPIYKDHIDKRVSSFHLDETSRIQLQGKVEGYRHKAGIIKDHLFPSIRKLWENNIEQSIAIIKPKKITSVYFRESTSDNSIMPQHEACPDVIPEIVIRYLCSDPHCETYHNMSLIDWEFTETLRKRINQFGLEKGKQSVKETILSLYHEKDVYFILGNAWNYYRYPKKWFIIGLLYIPNGYVNTWEW